MSAIESGRTFVITIQGVVPVEIPEGQEAAALVPGISASLAMASYIKAVSMAVEKESPASLAKRLRHGEAHTPKTVRDN